MGHSEHTETGEAVDAWSTESGRLRRAGNPVPTPIPADHYAVNQAARQSVM